MKKESVNKFDLEAAFKALEEIEIPVVKGIRPNRLNLQEHFTKKLTSEALVEDYYDVNDQNELEAAQKEREAEVAKAKLARIEKIVDLDAESEEDAIRLASSGKGYNGEDVDSIEMIGEPNITVEENE